MKTILLHTNRHVAIVILKSGNRPQNIADGVEDLTNDIRSRAVTSYESSTWPVDISEIGQMVSHYVLLGL